MTTSYEAFGLLALAALASGCAEGAAPEPSKPGSAAAQPARTSLRRPASAVRAAGEKASSQLSGGPPTADADPPALAETRPDEDFAQPKLLAPVDEDRVAAHGIRKFAGEHLTLYTDLPADAEIARLPELFDQAYPQWCAYFQRDDLAERAWPLRGCLMSDAAKFTAAGLLPDDLPAFKNGYTRGMEIWCREQTTAYYRRHLLLHEATHAFMFAAFGTCGPPWYMEAMAEFLGTHALDDNRLTLGAFPAGPDDVPGWGRIRMVREAAAAGRPLSVEEILAFTDDAYLRNEPYAWCWALAAFLDGHPRYHDRFRRLPNELAAGDFNPRVREIFADDWRQLQAEWRVFIYDLDFGDDLVRSAIDFAPGQPLEGEQELAVRADRGWQSSGVWLAAGQTYRLAASGRYQVASQPRPWWCEPGGVTIRYIHGRPLGMLLAAIVPDDFDHDSTQGFLSPVAVGLGATLAPVQSGVLYLRINDHPSELSDNAGTLQVRVGRQRDDRERK